MPRTSCTEKAGTISSLSAMASTYLIAYNAAQTVGWSMIAFITAQQYLAEGPNVDYYSTSSKLLQIFQTAALLEVVHCAVGIVRSSVVLTAFQVASRVMLVWGVLHSVPDTQSSVGFPMLLFAWTITEIIRYSYYVLNIVKMEAYPLVWLRYTTFIILYPIGVTGELTCIFRALPSVGKTGLYSLTLPNKYNFAFDYQYALVIIMFTYIPIFPQLYMHMFAQRRKIIGGGADKKKAQ